jgi:putative FmdB family regulatory protein
MPTYSYQCEACDREFEKEQRISEAAIRKCPSCGKLKLRRLITSGNFILKGGGWYSDGYGNSSKSAKSAKPSDAAGEPASSSESKTSGTTKGSKPPSGSGTSDATSAS